MRHLALLFYFISFSVLGQGPVRKNLRLTIQEATLFIQGAQVFESGKASIPSGSSTLLISNLSPFVDEKSIQVKGDGNFTIVSVNYRKNFLNEIKRTKQQDSLQHRFDELKNAIEKDKARLEVLKEKSNVLAENRRASTNTTAVTITSLKQLLEFYDSETSRIKEEEIRTNMSIAEKKGNQNKLEKEIADVKGKRSLPSGEIEMRVESDKALETTLTLTYFVSQAGWFPKYDIRVSDISSPLELVYKADVYQNTGIDWNNIKLKLSNGNPSQNSSLPELRPWGLAFTQPAYYRDASNSGREPFALATVPSVSGRVIAQEDGSPLPGVNVLVPGTTVGTVTDSDGRYSLALPYGAGTLTFSFIGFADASVAIGQRSVIDMALVPDVKQLTEVVVTGQGVGRSKRALGYATTSGAEEERNQPMQTTTIENQTTVEIEVDKPYTLASNSERLSVELSRYQITANYQYVAVPKLDKTAFLVAQIINWDQYNLLEGEANLFFENAYVGRTILNARTMSDTLNVSLGRDRSIVIGRDRNSQFSKRKVLGANIQESREFKIIARNKKSQPIQLVIYDQVPVQLTSEITVTPLEISGAKHEEKTGKLTWKLKLDPQKQIDLILRYEVKYPRRERLVLE